MLPENDEFLDNTAGLFGVVTSRVGVFGSCSPGEEFRGGVEGVSGVKMASPSVEGAPSDLWLSPDTGRLISGSARSAMVGDSRSICSCSKYDNVIQMGDMEGIGFLWRGNGSD